MPNVRIEDVGVVHFPDDMSIDDINKAIESEVIPQHTKQRLESSPSMRPVLPGQLETPSLFNPPDVALEPPSLASARRSLGQEEAPTVGYLPGRSPEELAARRTAISRAADLADLQRQATIDLAGTENGQARSLANALRDEKLRQLGFSLVNEGFDPNRGVIPFTRGVPTPPPEAGPVEKLATGVVGSAAGVGEFLTSPKGVAAMLNPAIGAGVLMEMATQVPDIGKRFGEAIANGDWKEAGKAGADALLAVTIGAKIGKEEFTGQRARTTEALARNIQEQIQSPEWQKALSDANLGATRTPTLGEQNAIRQQGAGGGVFRAPRSEVELQGVGGGNGPEIPAAGAEAKVSQAAPAKAGENVLPSLIETPEQARQVAAAIGPGLKSDGIFMRGSEKLFQFTPKVAGEAWEGATFYVPVGSTPEAVLDRFVDQIDKLNKNPPRRQMAADEIDREITKANELATGKKETVEEIRAKMRNRPVGSAEVSPPATPPEEVSPAERPNNLPPHRLPIPADFPAELRPVLDEEGVVFNGGMEATGGRGIYTVEVFNPKTDPTAQRTAGVSFKKTATPDEVRAKIAAVREARGWESPAFAPLYPDPGTLGKELTPDAWQLAILGLEAAKIRKPGEGASFALPHPEAIKAIGEAVWNTGLDVAINALKAGKTLAEAVRAAVDYMKRHVARFDEARIRDNLAEALRTGEEKIAPTSPRDPLAGVYSHFIPEPKQRPSIATILKEASEAFRTGFSSKFRPLDRMIEDLNKIYGMGLQKVSGIFEALKGSSGRSEAQVYRFDRDVSRLVKGNELDFTVYVFLRRSLDRLKQDEQSIANEQARVAAEPIVREGAELTREKAAEKRFTPNRRAVAGYTIPELESKLSLLQQRLGPQRTTRFEQAAQGFQKYMDQALRWQLESGRMSQDVYDKIKSENEFYAPFKLLRYHDKTGRPEGTGARIDTPAQYTKAMTGIEDPNFKLGDMLAAARMNIRVSRILADKHAAMRTIAEIAPFDVEQRFIRKLEGDQQPSPDQTAVNVYENGEHLRYAVPKAVAEALQLFQGRSRDLVSAVLSGAAIPFKAGAVMWNIPFQASNLLADVPRATLVSKTGINDVRDVYRFPIDFIQSAYASIMGDVIGKPNRLFLDFLDSGAAGTTIQESMAPNALRFQQSTRLTKNKNLAKDVLMTLPHLAAAIEQTTKILGVKRAMRMSGSESGADLYRQTREAVTEVRQFSGSPDFGRMGKQMEALRLNLLFMFLNARVQGAVADIGRLIGRDGAAVAGKTWLKLGLGVGVPTAVLYGFNHSSKQLADDYDKRSEQEKQNYWLIPKDTYITTDEGEKIRDYYRMPKRELAKWIANMVESSLNFAKNRSPEEAGRWFRSLVEDISPVNIQGRTAQERLESVASSLNPVLKAPIELATGRDTYRHRQLVPDQMKKASPENQFTDRTPEVYKRLANVVPDVAPEVFRSPIMLENLTQNLTAGMISQFLPKRPIEGRGPVENLPLLQRFQAAPYTDQRVFRESMDALQRQAADESLARVRLVDQLLRDNKGSSLPEIVRKGISQGGRDPALIERIVDSWVAKQNGITPQEKQVMALPAKERAVYLMEQLKGSTPEQKRTMIENWARKRILTESVAVEMTK